MQEGEADVALGCRLADGQSLGEVVQTDADRDHHRQAFRRRPLRHRRGELAGVGRSRAERAAAGAGVQSPVVVDEPDQSGGQADGEHGSEAGESPPAAAVVHRRGQRALDRLVGVAQHVEQQEDQNADGAGVQGRPHPWCGIAEPPHRKAQEDGQPGDRPRGNTWQHVATSAPSPNGAYGWKSRRGHRELGDIDRQK